MLQLSFPDILYWYGLQVVMTELPKSAPLHPDQANYPSWHLHEQILLARHVPQTDLWEANHPRRHPPELLELLELLNALGGLAILLAQHVLMMAVQAELPELPQTAALGGLAILLAQHVLMMAVQAELPEFPLGDLANHSRRYPPELLELLELLELPVRVLRVTWFCIWSYWWFCICC